MAGGATTPGTKATLIMGMGYVELRAHLGGLSFRKLMDYNRWWFTLAQCHDGSFHYQPNRDYNPYDCREASRVSASAAIALIFSAKRLTAGNGSVG